MSSVDIDYKNLKFTNKSASEFQIFKAKLRTLSRQKNKECFAAYLAEPGTYTNDGDADLYDLIITHTASSTLIQTMSNRFQDRGADALAYIASSWAPGKSDAKAKTAAKEYNALLTTGLGSDITIEQLRTRLNEMENMRCQLEGTNRCITDLAHCNNIWDMVGDVSSDIENNLKFASLNWKDGDWADIGVVSACLEDAVTEYAGKRAKLDEGSRRAIPSDNIDKLVAALAGMKQGGDGKHTGGGRKPPDLSKPLTVCDQCGVPHPFAGDKTKCHTVIPELVH